MLIAVAGATGTVGSHVADLLDAGGHEVRRLSRGSDEFPVDVATGAGLKHALAGVEVVINAVNGPPGRRSEPVLLEGTRQLTAAARGAHHVLVSIVGIERLPIGYYRLKLAQERALADSRVRHTIVRSTQFHELVGGPLLALGRLRIELRSDARFQPIAAAEAAAVLARVAVEGAAAVSSRPAAQHDSGATLSVAGPQTLTLSEMAARRGLPLPLWLPRGLAGPLAAGALTDPDPDVRGVQSFHQWLAQRSGTAWVGRRTPSRGAANVYARALSRLRR